MGAVGPPPQGKVKKKTRKKKEKKRKKRKERKKGTMNNVQLIHIKCCFFQFFDSPVPLKKKILAPQEKVEMTLLSPYGLRPSSHNRIIPRADNRFRRNFIIRMLYKYRLPFNFLFSLTSKILSMLCFTLILYRTVL